MSVTITTDGGVTTLATPYHPDLPARARAIGGRFHAADKTWRFDARDEQRVRDLAQEIYGTDGTPGETVTVRCHWDRLDYDQQRDQTLWLAGREIARRPSRDADVQLGEKVILIAGGFPGRGGSTQYPVLDAQEGTVLEIRDLPANHPDLDHEAIEAVDASVDRDALVAERDRLMARLQEIDAILGDSHE